MNCLECGGRLIFDHEWFCTKCGLVHATIDYAAPNLRPPKSLSQSCQYGTHNNEEMGSRRKRTGKPECAVCGKDLPTRLMKYCPQHSKEMGAKHVKAFKLKKCKCISCGKVKRQAIKNLCGACYKRILRRRKKDGN